MKIQNWNKIVRDTKILQAAIEVMNIISSIQKNVDVFIVGGTVRDLVMSAEAISDLAPMLCGSFSCVDFINDVDIATSLSIDVIEPLFKCHDIGNNKDFYILVVEHKGFHFEVSNFRTDGVYSDGRRPDSVDIIDSFEHDAERRDFSINAMGLDKDGNVVDFFKGCQDIDLKVIRTVGDPKKRFSEDYLRMLRAVRFATRFDFTIEQKTFEAIKINAHKIKEISSERILKELNKMAELSGKKFAHAIDLMYGCGLLQYILPEICDMKNFKHNPEFHPEGNSILYGHVIEALKCNDVPDRLINWAILFHDLGKLKTYTYSETGHHYYKHHLEAGDIIDSIADRLKFDNETRDVCKFVAVNHMVMHDFLKVKKSLAMKLINDPYWYVLLKVAETDSKARGELHDAELWFKIESRVETLKQWFTGKQAIDAIRKVVNGHMVMRVCPDVIPSPEMGRIIKDTVEWIIDNQISLDDVEKIEEYMKTV